MADKLRLRIVTREGVKLDDECDMVVARCSTGDMGVLPRHAECSAVLDYGALRVINDGTERKIAVFAGVMQIKDDVVTILTNEAQFPEDIDRARADADLDYFSLRVQEEEDDVELQKHQAKIRRTLVRIEVSSYPLINPSDKAGGA
ncbi:MAG: ATP synthase F1 subunit epsilon [Oscillospiraceae bacterium]|nr:ATP synthase F1 subunit epsilon [Oscillospiraceae bacterium]